MGRQLFYCKSWFGAKRRPTEIWTESQAKEAHLAGKPYTVLVDSMQAPFCAVTVTDKFVGVDFFDQQIREALTYNFQEVSPRQLFLTMATHRDFEGSTDQVASGTTYMFDQDGTVRSRREIFLPEYRLEVSTSRTNVTGNYSAFPKFGAYDDVIRIERA